VRAGNMTVSLFLPFLRDGPGRKKKKKTKKKEKKREDLGYLLAAGFVFTCIEVGGKKF